MHIAFICMFIDHILWLF